MQPELECVVACRQRRVFLQAARVPPGAHIAPIHLGLTTAPRGPDQARRRLLKEA